MKATVLRALAVVVAILASGPAASLEVPAEEIRVDPVDAGVRLTLPVAGLRVGTDFEAEAEMLSPYGTRLAHGVASGPTRRRQAAVEVELAWSVELSRRGRLDIAFSPIKYRVSMSGRDSAVVTGTVTAAEVNPDAFQLVAVAPAGIVPGQAVPIRVAATHPISGLPVAGVEVRAKIGDEVVTGLTGRDGVVLLEPALPKVYAGERPIYGEKAGFRDEAWVTFKNMGRPRLVLATDRKRVEPGGTLGIRVAALSHRGHAASGQQVQVEVGKKHGPAMFLHRLSTDRLGVASTVWQIPDDAPPGTYKVRAVPTEQLAQELDIEVGHAQPPRPFLDVSTHSGCVASETPPKVSLRVTASSGAPIPEAPVSILRRYGVRPVWEGRTDAAGTAMAELDLEHARSQLEYGWKHAMGGWRQARRAFEERLVARAEDPASGVVVTRPFAVSSSYQAIHVHDASPWHHPIGLPLRLLLLAQRPDGSPARCSLICRRPDGSLVARGSSDMNGVALLVSPQPLGTEDDRRVEVIATDDNGHEGTLLLRLTTEDQPALRVLPAKVLHRPGEPTAVGIAANLPTLDVVVEALSHHEIVSSSVVQVKEGKGRCRIPFDDRFRGEVTVRAYTPVPPDPHRRVPADTATVVYRRADRFDISLELASDRPRACAPVEGEVRLSFGDGRRVPTSVALAVVERDSDPETDGWFLDRAVGVPLRDRLSVGDRFFWLEERTSGPAGVIAGLRREDLPWRVAVDDPETAAQALLAWAKPVPRSPSRPERVYPFREANAHQRVVAVGISEARSRALGGARKQLGKLGAVAYRGIKAWQEGHHRAPLLHEDTLRAVLAEAGTDLETVRDPWGRRLGISRSVSGRESSVWVMSAGLDGRLGTADDLRVTSASGWWLPPFAGALKEAAVDRFQSDRRWPTSVHELVDVVARRSPAMLGFSPEEGCIGALPCDPWGRPIVFELTNLPHGIKIDLRSLGELGELSEEPGRNVKASSFVGVRAVFEDLLERALNEWIGRGRTFPSTEGEIAAFARDNQLDGLVLPDGTPLELKVVESVALTSTVLEDGVMRSLGKPAQARFKRLGLWAVRRGDQAGNELGYPAGSVARATELIDGSLEGELVRRLPSEASAHGGAIHGTVRFEDRPVPKVRVSARHLSLSPEYTRSSLAGADGRFEFSRLPPGRFELTFQLAGCETVTTRVTVEDGRTERIEVEMAMARDPNEPPQLPPHPPLKRASKGESPDEPIPVPQTLLFEPSLHPDDEGKVRFTIPAARRAALWRVMAVAHTADGRMASAEIWFNSVAP